ncbi:MAG: hypothetical protein R3B41_02040 [Candidatus Doudnabacteria bacterium]
MSQELKNIEVNEINSEIQKSVPIGKAFRDHGFKIRKNVIDVFLVKISPQLKTAFRTNSDFAKSRLSEFYAKKENIEPIIYGTVVEIYSPDFREPVINDTDVAQINPSTSAFNNIGISINEIWERLGKDNDWDDISEIFNQAKHDSLSSVEFFKKKIKNLQGLELPVE